MARASGSYPEGHWFKSSRRYQMWDHSSAGRAPALQAGGHRFEPYCAHHSSFCGRVVQLVRMPACHAGGRRFEPVPGRHFLRIAVGVVKRLRPWVVAPVFVGSNPTIHPKFSLILHELCGTIHLADGV